MRIDTVVKKHDTPAMSHPATTAPNLSRVLHRIRAWAAANDLKPATLARQAEISEVVTRDMAEKGWSPSSKSIRSMEALIPTGWQAGDPLPAPDEPNAIPLHPEVIREAVRGKGNAA